MKPLAVCLLFVCLSGSATGAEIRPFQGKYPPDLPEAQQHVYKTIGETELKLWLYRPATRDLKPRPTIVFYFGGGWNGGSPDQFENQCRYLAERGMIAVTVDYRVKSRHSATPFDCVEDAKSAIRWLRQNAQRLGIDPNKIVASGGSAGGHVACCTGVITGFDNPGEDAKVSSVPNTMALFNPAVMLANFGDHKLLDEAKAKSLSERLSSRAGEISPIEHLRAELPPTIIFHGTNDEAVPFETVQLYTQLAQKLGNRCELKAYPGEPHGFFNPRLRNPDRKEAELRNYHSTLAQLDQFLVSLDYLAPLPAPAAIEGTGFSAITPNIVLRESFHRSREKFRLQKRGHVAFLGGSITEMNGYRPMMMEWLKGEYPETAFQFTNAGIASTCSTTGAFRLERDILSQGSPDLLFVEFAVNDDQDAHHTREASLRGMEGIIRKLRVEHPHCDIVMIYFVNPEMRDAISISDIPVPIAAHAAVARHYGVSTIHLAREVAERIERGDLTWEIFGGTHPAPAGNRICAEMIAQLLSYDRDHSPTDAVSAERKVPANPLDPLSYSKARFLDLASIAPANGWSYSEPAWDSLSGSKRDRFLKRPLLHATEPGSTIRFSISGTTATAFVLAGPDAGTLEVSVDGGPATKVNLFHGYSKGLHYPRSVVLATDLPPGPHELTLTVSAEKHSDSTGHAIRILELGEN